VIMVRSVSVSMYSLIIVHCVVIGL